jgi:hypothetical protein
MFLQENGELLMMLSKEKEQIQLLLVAIVP